MNQHPISRRIRTNELPLCFLAAAIPLAGQAVVLLGQAGKVSIDPTKLASAVWIAASVLSIAVAWTATSFRGDQVLLPVIGCLAALGFVILASLEPDLRDLDSGLA